MAVAEGMLIADRYRLARRLASDGTGETWAAHDVGRGVAVAAKRVELDPDATPEERQFALANARAGCQHAVGLRFHPNVVTVYDVAEHTDGAPWMIMDLVVGRSLADILRTYGRIDVATARAIGVAVLSALASAHAVGIVHGDVKPSSIMLADDGRILLTGFGSGSARRPDDARTGTTGMRVSNLMYMAPEHFDGVTGPAGDLFALGVTLYQALEGGQSPFHRDSVESTIEAIRTVDPPFPANAGDLAPLLWLLLAKDHTTRVTAPAALAMMHGEQAVVRPSVSPIRQLEVSWQFVISSMLLAALVVLSQLPVAVCTLSFSGERVVVSMHDMLSPWSGYNATAQKFTPVVYMAVILGAAGATTVATALQRRGTERSDRIFGYLGAPLAIAGFAHEMNYFGDRWWSPVLRATQFDPEAGKASTALAPTAWVFCAIIVAMLALYVSRDIVQSRRAGLP
jgi:serine/threonine protein kinase